MISVVTLADVVAGGGDVELSVTVLVLESGGTSEVVPLLVGMMDVVVSVGIDVSLVEVLTGSLDVVIVSPGDEDELGGRTSVVVKIGDDDGPIVVGSPLSVDVIVGLEVSEGIPDVVCCTEDVPGSDVTGAAEMLEPVAVTSWVLVGSAEVVWEACVGLGFVDCVTLVEFGPVIAVELGSVVPVELGTIVVVGIGLLSVAVSVSVGLAVSVALGAFECVAEGSMVIGVLGSTLSVGLEPVALGSVVCVGLKVTLSVVPGSAVWVTLGPMVSVCCVEVGSAITVALGSVVCVKLGSTVSILLASSVCVGLEDALSVAASSVSSVEFGLVVRFALDSVEVSVGLGSVYSVGLGSLVVCEFSVEVGSEESLTMDVSAGALFPDGADIKKRMERKNEQKRGAATGSSLSLS